MPVPGSIVIKSVVRGFSLVHRGNLQAYVSTSFRTGEGVHLPPLLRTRRYRGVMDKYLIAVITPFIPLILRGIFNQRPLLRLVLSEVEG